MSTLLRICAKLWQAEPVVIAAFGSVAFWSALFALLAAFNHPLTQQQQTALEGFGVLVATFLARQTVIAPDTHAETLANIQKVNQ